MEKWIVQQHRFPRSYTQPTEIVVEAEDGDSAIDVARHYWGDYPDLTHYHALLNDGKDWVNDPTGERKKKHLYNDYRHRSEVASYKVRPYTPPPAGRVIGRY